MIPGTSSTKSLVCSMNGGIRRATIDPTTATAPSRVTSAPTARGTPRRSSFLAASASGMEMMIVTRTASISVTSWRNSKPTSSRPAASRTAR